MKELIVIRHAEATGQPANAPLTENGMRQAEELAAFLVPLGIDKIVASPFVRAVQTIQPLATRLNLEVEVDPRLAERILSTDPLDDWLVCLKRTFDELDVAYPGGESTRQAMTRATAAVGDIMATAAERSVIVTHGNLMTLLLKSYDASYGYAAWVSLTNPDVYTLTVDGGAVHVHRIWRD